MARRNPMNERYGKYTAPSGKTRKSAASAKPKRTTGPASSSDAGKKAAPPKAKLSPADLNPNTPEFRRWRTVWWALLGSAVVFATATWWLWKSGSRALGNYSLMLSYALIFGGIFLDWTKLRPMRQAWIKAGGAAGAEKARQAQEKAEKKAETDKSTQPDEAPANKS